MSTRALRQPVWSVLWLCAVGSACSPSLDGFVCATSESCGGERLCIDGACASDDAGCASGTRWDESAGDRSSSCTGEQGNSSVELDGETVSIASGWRVAVFREISSDYTYKPNDYSDSDLPASATVFDNEPLSIVSLDAPFQPGLAIIVGRRILELGDDGAPRAIHDYTPTAGNVYPDRPVDLEVASPTNGMPGRLLVAGSSSGGGDGVFQIDSQWALEHVRNGQGAPIDDNNVGATIFDPAGQFEDVSSAETYYSVTSTAPIFRARDRMSMFADSSLSTRDLALRPTGALVVVSADEQKGNLQVVFELDVPNAQPRFVADVIEPYLRLVSGDPRLLPSGIHAVDRTRLRMFHDDGTVEVIASTATEGWQWNAATVGPPDPTVPSSGPRFYVVESNRTANRDRILVLSRR